MKDKSAVVLETSQIVSHGQLAQLGPLQPAHSVAEGCRTSGNRGGGLTRVSAVSTICVDVLVETQSCSADPETSL